MADRKIYNETLSAESTLGKRVWNDFEIKNLEPYHDLYVRSRCIWKLSKILSWCELDPVHFLTASRFAWQAALEKK